MQSANTPASFVAKATALPWRVAARIADRGLWNTVRRIAFLTHIRYREFRLGIRTEAFIPRAEITDDPCSVDYEPVGYRTLDRALRHVRPDPARDVFLDYGCGQGRALAVAAQRSFQKIIGVELSSALAAVARSNLDRARSKLRCRDCRVIAANAIEFNVPDDVSVIFLFNPFRGEVLEAAIDRIEASLRRRPRQLTILYVQPIRDKNVFAEQPWLVEKVNTLSEGLRLAVYESTVAADTSDHCHNRANQRASQHAI